MDRGVGKNLAGRDDELRELGAVWESARGGSARIAGIEGEPGIGKTAVVDRLLDEVDAPVIRVSGAEIDATTPWTAFRDVVMQTPGRRLADLAGRLDNDAEPNLIGSELVSDLRSPDGLVVVVDQAQWVDSQSLMALQYVTRRMRYDPILVIVAYRPPDPESPVPYFGRGTGLFEAWKQLFTGERGLYLRLGGLAAEDLIRLAAQAGHSGLSPEGAMRLHEATGGNPAHVLELLQLVPMHSIVADKGPLQVPRDLAPTIAARLASCEPETRELVSAAAVLGRRFTVAAVREVSGLDSVGRPVEEAIGNGLMAEVPGTGGRELMFPKRLTREVLYHDLSRRARTELHRRCVPISSGDAALAHRIAAADGADEELAADLTKVARERIAASDIPRAAHYLQHALDCTPTSPARLPLLLLAIESLLVAGDLVTTREYESELQRAPAGPWRDYVLGYQKLLSGRVAEATGLLRGALAELDRTGPESAEAPADLRARIATQLAIVGVVYLSYPEMVEYGSIAVTAGSDEPWVKGFAWFAKTIGMALAGDSTEALSLLAHAGEPADGSGMEGLVARGMIRLWTDDLTGASDDLHHAVRRATRGEALRISQGLGFLGEVEYRRGRLSEARLFTAVAVGNAEVNDRAWDFPILHALASYPSAATADWRTAEHHAAESAHWAGLINTNSAQAYAAGARAAIAQARGDDERLLLAAEHIDAHYDSHEPGTHLFGPLLADALCRLGRLEEAERALAAFRDGPGSRGRRSAEMGVARVAAQIELARHRLAEALAMCEKATELAASIGLPLEAGRIRLLTARCLRGQGRRAAAERELRRARRQFVQIGAEAYRVLAEQEADRLGFAIGMAAPVFEGLTRREREVALLAAQGWSNAEIAGRHHLSEKTVESHLTHSYRKLNIANRHELTQIFRDAL